MHLPFKFRPGLAAIACIFALSACASGGGKSPDVHPTETLNKVTPSPTDKGSHSEIVDGKDQDAATPAQPVDKQDTGTHAGSDSGTQGDTPKNNNPQAGQGETARSVTDGKDQGAATPAQPVDKQDTGEQGSSDAGVSVLKPNNSTPIVPTTSEKLDQAIKAIENTDKEIADKEKQAEEKEAIISSLDNSGSPPADLIKGAREYTNSKRDLQNTHEAKVAKEKQQIKQLEDAVKLLELRKAEVQSSADQADLESKKAELEKQISEQKVKLASSEQKLEEVKTDVQRLEKFTEYLGNSSLKEVKPELSQRVWESKLREFKNLGSYEKKFETAALFKAYLISENQDKQDTAFTEEKVRDMDVYINGEKYEGKDGDEYAVKPLGLQSQTVEIYGQDKDQNYHSEKSWVYEQPYSVVAGYFTQTIQNGKKDEDGADKLDIGLSDIQGLATEEAQLPKVGAFDYEGKAFGGSSAKPDSKLEEHQGEFKYRIDFDKRKGSGSIEGLSEYGRIDLKEADIVKGNNLKYVNKPYYGIDNGEAASERGGLKYYSLGIFGPEANEVTGVVGTSGDQDKLARDVGFGGQKK